MKYQNFYQSALILFALLVIMGVGAFTYHELFPEYKTYQFAYKDLEAFRSTYTHQEPALFATGIKQLLLPQPGGSLDVIDRCTSCHVATNLPHFSKTRPAHDVNDQQIFDAQGNPALEENPDYIWARLQQRIDELKSPLIVEELHNQGREKEIKKRLKAASQLERLKWVEVEGKRVDLEKVLQMHPLIGEEVRPFQFHSLDQYGCTTCHSGNGQSLVAKRAHGPLYDGEYEPAHMGKQPQFTEIDLENDPPFSRMYNHKPSHELVFQTTPLLAGPLLVAKCVQCHQTGQGQVQAAIQKFSQLADFKKQQLQAIQKGLDRDHEALRVLNELQKRVAETGREETIEWLNQKLKSNSLTSDEIDHTEGQLAFLNRHEESALAIQLEIDQLRQSIDDNEKQKALKEGHKSLKAFEQAQEPLKFVMQDKKLIQQMQSNVDRLIHNYQRGKELFVSQACYACHRIAGFSRASVGPELTYAGNQYPWYIKESIVWPQADLPSSTMPNFRLDHEELGDLVTFLMAQKGETRAISEMDYQIGMLEWEKGEKMPWEMPVPPTDIENYRAGQLVFASEGCASCHKLKGFDSSIGLQESIEDKQWFTKLFPERISGTDLAKMVLEKAVEIDAHIGPRRKENGILEEIEKIYPGLIGGFYTNFKFAARAYNTALQNDPKSQATYHNRLHNVLMTYIQEYGLGRDIAPHLNWSGVFRDNEWLMGHFHNPPAYTARSIMPVMPFDDTKFYMLNYMLHQSARNNRDQLQEVWRVQGFNPALAYEYLCSSCHGPQRQGNGIISEWIYPIPKNLRNPIFLRNLTKERAIDSIMHGVKGTPMPPWGEAISPTELGDNLPILSRAEIVQLVDWLYQNVPYEPRVETKKDFAKWNYNPSDIIVEMKKEKHFLKPTTSEASESDAQSYFEERANPIPGPDEKLYYIRDIYYTPENLLNGKQFFMTNCATCHGNEGGGTGLRATSMVEAKPRMFTNLPWLRTRDDLHLLRSIKYGVPGTSMVAWGDQTTAAQRMQLVMFIRELTKPSLLQSDLEELLYGAYDRQELTIEEARKGNYQQLQQLNDEEQSIQLQLTQELEAEGSVEKLGSLYTRLIELKREIESRSRKDQMHLTLIQLVKNEKLIYASLGAHIIASGLPSEADSLYFEIAQSQHLHFSIHEGHLNVQDNPSQTRAQIALASLLKLIDDKIEQNPSSEQRTYVNLRAKLLMQLANAAELRHKQKNVF